jgi:3',5'-cyclic AMP phosphodiesterase CpdA
MYKLLNLIIIDDDHQRQPIYDAFIKAYNNSKYKKYELIASFAFTCNAALDLLKTIRGTSIIMLDMVHDWPKDNLRNRIIGMAIPMIALSEQFNSQKATEEYIYYAEKLKKPPPIIHFRNLRDALKKSNWETVLDVFATHLSVLMDLQPSADWDHNRSVNILHMTDIHMSSVSLSSSELLDIAAALNRNEKRPIDLTADFIAITGDLTNRGDIVNFEKAHRRVRELFECGWMRIGTPKSIPSSRVLVAPGNHDFSEQLAGAKLLTNSAVHPSGFEVATGQLDNWPNWYYGLLPFAAFHRGVTGFASWELEDMPGYRINAGFKAQGLFFLEIWVQEFRCGKSLNVVPAEWIDSAIAKAQKELSENTVKGDTVVVLLHALSAEDPKRLDSRIIHMLTNVAEERTVILLTGHLHTSKTDVHKLSDGQLSRILHVRTDTMNPSQGRDGTLPCFAVVELKRNQFVVESCAIHRIEFKADTGWTRNDTRTMHFELQNDVWSMTQRAST